MQNHIEETQSPKEAKQENTIWLCLCLLSITLLSQTLIGDRRNRHPLSLYIIVFDYLVSLIPAFTKFSAFLLLLHFLPISSLCLISWFSSFIFPVEKLGSSYFSCSSAFAFFLVFLLYHFYAFFLPSLVSHYFLTFIYIYIHRHTHRILIFSSVLSFCLTGGWIWIGVTLFWDV